LSAGDAEWSATEPDPLAHRTAKQCRTFMSFLFDKKDRASRAGGG